MDKTEQKSTTRAREMEKSSKAEVVEAIFKSESIFELKSFKINLEEYSFVKPSPWIKFTRIAEVVLYEFRNFHLRSLCLATNYNWI